MVKDMCGCGKKGLMYSAEGICDFLQLNYLSCVITLYFVYALACLIYISRTFLDLLFCLPVTGEGELRILYILQF